MDVGKETVVNSGFCFFFMKYEATETHPYSYIYTHTHYIYVCGLDNHNFMDDDKQET